MSLNTAKHHHDERANGAVNFVVLTKNGSYNR